MNLVFDAFKVVVAHYAEQRVLVGSFGFAVAAELCILGEVVGLGGSGCSA